MIPRVFRPIYLDVFELTNLELGTCFSAYGFVALVSYLFGGYLADKYNPRILITIAMILTSIGGFVLSTYPSFSTLMIIYAFWGFSTVFLFWAAMIKATSAWGGEDRQGLAFGFLEGGRGLIASLMAAAGITVLAFMLPSEEISSMLDRKSAFRSVILMVSCIVLLFGVISFLFLPKGQSLKISNRIYFMELPEILKNRRIWLIMIIICCGYVGYKITGYFSLYASDILGFNDIESSQVGGLVLYMRPVVAILLGLLTLRIGNTKLIALSFSLIIAGALSFTIGFIKESEILFFFISMLFGLIGIYGARALYFTLIRESGVSYAKSGTAVGLASAIGFTPDIFVGPWTGAILDNNPGILGFQYTFFILFCFSIVGLVATLLFARSKSKLVA